MHKNNVKVIERATETDFRSDSHGALLSRIYAARGVSDSTDLVRSLKSLHEYTDLLNIEDAADLIRKHIEQQQKIVVVGDFDADGATSTALLVAFLRDIGHSNVDYVIPNRFETGYGLSKALIDQIISDKAPELIITVDHGITAIEEVAYIKSKGIAVIITDHHMPSEHGVPVADHVINPNLPNHPEGLKHLAGVGVAFYLTIAVRAALRSVDYFKNNALADINLAQYLDLVALGTVADMVVLDHNNRLMVHQGLMRVKNGCCRPGISALLAVSQKDATMITSSDFGYAVAPRLNAAGRISKMSIGVECLLTTNFERADILAEKLHDLNLERREIEMDMQASAQKIINDIVAQSLNATLPVGVCLYDAAWHQGVSGIIASRLKDAFKRPIIVFANAQLSEDEGGQALPDDQEIKGSARSIKGLDIRQVLANINAAHPELILKFGGHKGAAGLTIRHADFKTFSDAFQQEIAKELSEEDCYETLLVDGELRTDELNIDTASLVRHAGPWGMGFPEPTFVGVFNIMEQRIVGQRHLKLAIQPRNGYEIINAIHFNVAQDMWPDHNCQSVRAVYRLDVTEYRGSKALQLIILHVEKHEVNEQVGIAAF